MAIIVNTNMSAIQIQGNLSKAGDAMKVAMQRMSTGSKINTAADDAAGMAVSAGFQTQISGSKIAQQNATLGSNLLTTSEGTLNVVQGNLQRIRDLVEQAANGTYNQKAKTAIRTEIMQRSAEIDRLGAVSEFNGIKLFDTATTGTNGVALQVGSGAAAPTNVITLAASMFANINVSSIGLVAVGGAGAAINDVLGDASGVGATTGAALATAVTALMTNCDTAIGNIVDRKTAIGGNQNRLGSAVESLKVQFTNLTAANSTIKDADIAEESASFVQNQILQQASASLLAQANQAPSIAINLI